VIDFELDSKLPENTCEYYDVESFCCDVAGRNYVNLFMVHQDSRSFDGYIDGIYISMFLQCNFILTSFCQCFCFLFVCIFLLMNNDE
jgi:hypothetical protein